MLLDSPAASAHSVAESSGLRLRDSFGRAITDLRISVTDRCNYKCVYCRAGDEGASYTELPIADYLRMVRILVSLGIEKVRLTGGEPLLRSGLVEMVAELARMSTAFHADGTRLDAQRGWPAARHRAYHQWPSAGVPRRAACSRRAQPRHRQHGRGRPRDLHPHHPRAAQL